MGFGVGAGGGVVDDTSQPLAVLLYPSLHTQEYPPCEFLHLVFGMLVHMRPFTHSSISTHSAPFISNPG